MVMHWRRPAAAVVMGAVGLVGCSTGGEKSPVEPTPAVSLVGPTWRLTTIAGQPVLAGTTVDAVFSSEARVGGTAGCNRYFGSAQAEAGRLTVGPLGATLMACSPEAVMDQEARYLATLQAAKRYTISAQLRLGPSAAEVTLVFTAR